MLKLNASFSKKVPAEVEYSSKSYLASIEVELPAGMSGQQLRQKIAETFALVRESVETEINGNMTNKVPSAKTATKNKVQAPEGIASNKQIKYILDLGKAREKRLADLNKEVGQLYGVESIYDLTKKDASRFVDELKEAA